MCIMGGMCCKPSAIEDSKESPRERLSGKAVLDSRVSRGTSSRREESYRVKDRYDNNDARVGLIDKQGNGTVRVQADNFERKREKMEYVVAPHPVVGSVPKAMEGEQVAAGWPSWLAAVAGEAIKGWLPRRADSFEKLDKVCFFSLIWLPSDIVTMLSLDADNMFFFLLCFLINYATASRILI